MPFNYQVLKADSPGNNKDAVQKFLEIMPGIDSDFDAEGVANYDGECASFVETYQAKNGLVADGILGPNTWRAMLNEDIDVNNREEGSEVAQPNPQQCWRAATATLLRRPLASIQYGSATYISGGLENSEANLKLYASEHELTYVKTQVTVSSILAHIKVRRRVMANIDDDYAGVMPGNNTHWVVVYRFRCDQFYSAGSISITFWDPLPSGLGSTRTLSYSRFKKFYKCTMHRQFA